MLDKRKWIKITNLRENKNISKTQKRLNYVFYLMISLHSQEIWSSIIKNCFENIHVCTLQNFTVPFIVSRKMNVVFILFFIVFNASFQIKWFNKCQNKKKLNYCSFLGEKVLKMYSCSSESLLMISKKLKFREQIKTNFQTSCLVLFLLSLLLKRK